MIIATSLDIGKSDVLVDLADDLTVFVRQQFPLAAAVLFGGQSGAGCRRCIMASGRKDSQSS